MFELNYDNASYCKLSNDAFFNILYGEEMLDEKNQAEVDALYAKYQNGFEIEEGTWDSLSGEDAGYVECTIIPYEESQYAYTHKIRWSNYTEMHIAFNTDKSKVHIRFGDIPEKWLESSGDEGRGFWGEEDCEIKTNVYGNAYFEYGNSTHNPRSTMYLKRLKLR